MTEIAIPCSSCLGKQKTETDLWADTAAAWQPCAECCSKDYADFWDLADDNDRMNWFTPVQV